MKMKTPGGLPRYRPWEGPALLAAGFRPFFLLAGLWAAIAIPLWLAILEGYLQLPSAFDPVTWHAREMLFGFAQAAIAGFLLTAVPNWTGRMPLQGWPLAGLVVLFLAGRAAVACSQEIGPAAAAIDLAFPIVLLAALAREIIAGENWRNLPMLAALGALIAANGLTHLEAFGVMETDGLGLRLGIAVIVALISLIGGRIIPSFTRNWLVKRGETHLPAPFDRFDAATLALGILALAVWTAAPEAILVGPLMAMAALANLLRLARWQGLRTLAEPLVWVLHLGFLWLPLGFALMAASRYLPAVSPSVALHAFTGGAIATMILAVSTRATLGHTGRALLAGRGTLLIYVLITMAAAARVAAGILPGGWEPLLATAGLAWFAAFAVYLGVYGPILLAPRPR